MTLQDLGSLGELIAAVATVATLFYLAAQIRQNTLAVRANTFQGVVDSLTNGIAEIARDPEATRIWVVALQQSGDLTDVERGRFHLLMLMAMRKWENAFYQNQGGTLEEPQWAGILQDIRSITRQPGFRSWWQGTSGLVSSQFREFVDRLIGDAE